MSGYNHVGLVGLAEGAYGGGWLLAGAMGGGGFLVDRRYGWSLVFRRRWILTSGNLVGGHCIEACLSNPVVIIHEGYGPGYVLEHVI